MAVTEFFPAEAKILDVGCGLGREAFVLSDMGYKVTGIDISQEVIAQVVPFSVQKGYDIPFSVYDGHKLPFEADSFDVVIVWAQTFGLLYGNEYKHEFLLECKRVLTNGGLLSYSAHDYRFLMAFAKDAGYTLILCEKGEIYIPEDGTILHCLCRK